MTAFTPNYEKGHHYLWAPSATLTCYAIGPMLLRHHDKDRPPAFIPLFIDRPKDSREYTRCRIEVVRTSRECASLERAWPGVVTTKRRFGRPQHVITYNWRKFDTPLRLKPEFVGKKWAPNEYGLKLTAVAEVKSPRLRELLKQAP